MPKNEISSVEDLNKMISGVTSLGQLEQMFRDPKFKKMFKDLTKAEIKKIKIDTNVTGLKDVKDLEAAFKNVLGESEEYFKKLDKYRSTTKALNLAFREGSTHMREYLKEAEMSGGKLAVFGAASTYLVKTFNEQIKSIKDSVMAINRYNIEQDKFSSISSYSTDTLKKMRNELELSKKEMVGFYDTLSDMETLGFNADEITNTFLSLKKVYGEDAMNMMKGWTEILNKLPSMASKIRKGTGPSVSDVYNMMESGNYKKFLQLRIAGITGGKTTEESKAAALENYNRSIEFYTEKIKDGVLDIIPKHLITISTALTKMSPALQGTSSFAGIAGALAQIKMMTMMGGLGKTSGGGRMGGIASGMGGFFGKAGLIGGALGAGWEVGSLINSALAPTLQKNADAKTKKMIEKLDKEMASSGNKTYAEKGEQYWKDLRDKEQDPLRKRALDKIISSKGAEMSTARKETEKEALGSSVEITNVFEALKKFEEQWNMYYDNMTMTARTMSEIAVTSGDSVKAMSSIEEYSKLHEERMEVVRGFYNEEIKKLYDVKKNASSWGKDQEEEFKSTLAKYQKGLAEEEKRGMVEAMENRLDMIASLYQEMGGSGNIETERALRRKGAVAGTTAEKSVLGGGDVGALRELRQVNIELAQSQVKALDATLKRYQEEKKGNLTKTELAILEKKITTEEENRAYAIRNLNEAIKNTDYIDSFRDRMSSVRQVLSSLTDVVTSLDGSFSSLQPLMAANIKNTEKMRDAAKEEFESFKKTPGVSPDSKDWQLKRDKLAMAELDVVKSKFEYAKQERDLRLSEIDMQVGWQREQADFYAEMGGHFGDVLSMRSRAVQNERESIGVLEKYLSSGMLSGKERMSAEIELERKKMNITRESIGIQKDAYEKFVGMAFGQLGDVGFKRGRMDASVLMGTGATRVKNKAGMFVGGGMGMNRDQMTALTATGFGGSGGGNYGGYVEPELVRGETEAKKASGLASAEAQKVDVQTHITVEPSKEFNVVIKETVVNVMKTMGKSWGRTN